MIECPFDDNQVMCIEDDGSCCAPCASFPETSIPNGYIATETCTCCGKKQYKIAINPCTGYQECQYGGAENSLSCQSGDIIKYNICKECPNACPENSSCPTGAVCQFDSCSGSYCPTGCKTGYTNYCSMPNTDCRSLGYHVYDAVECAGKVVVRCPYDSSWTICETPEDGTDCCRNCEKLPYKGSLPYGYIATETCRCCGSVYYDGVPNTCEGYLECPFGGAEGASSCTTPDGVRYSACKECATGCPGNSTCPTGAVCQYDSCSKTYCPTGCKAGYSNYCSTPDTDCRSLGYYLANNCWITNTVKCPYNTNYVFCY